MKSSRNWLVAVVAAGICALGLGASASPTLTTLVTFNGYNGLNPVGGLIMDSGGNLYGVTSQGGTSYNPDPNVDDPGVGTVFMVSAGTHQLTTLASFSNETASQYGGTPRARPALDGNGYLYGTTSGDGPHNRGTIFKVDVASHVLSAVVAFDGKNGGSPTSGLTPDGSGNLFGAFSDPLSSPPNGGIIVKLAVPSDSYSVLASFAGANSGLDPNTDLIQDSAGNLYGTTIFGGIQNGGTVFRFSPSSNSLTILAALSEPSHAALEGSVVVDKNGNVFGTTQDEIFEINHLSNELTVLANLPNANIENGLILDANGNLFGMTMSGGAFGYGSIFELNISSGNLSTLISFDGTNGSTPSGALLADESGNLYGEAGIIFKLTDSGFVVPEPSSIATFGISTLLLLHRRVRR